MVDQAGSGMTGFHQLIMVAAAEISTRNQVSLGCNRRSLSCRNYQQQLLQPTNEKLCYS